MATSESTNSEEEAQKQKKGTKWDVKGVKQELKKQFMLAIPMIITNLLQFGIQLVSIMFVGHLSELALSSVSVASSICAVTGFSVLAGMSCALDTLCGQAYGAGKHSLIGLYMYRALIILNATGIALAFVWANVKNIMLALRQDPYISENAGVYTIWLIPGLFACATAQPLLKFLQAQSIVIPIVLSLAFTFCCHILVCWMLIYRLKLGIRGAALATCISSWINVILLAIYITFSPSCKKARTPFSTKAFHDVMGFLRLALPSALMICLEWWSYEALVLLSGWLPNPELETSAISICYNSAAFVFMIPSGFGAMASIRVANELGAGWPNTAKRVVYIAILIAAFEAMLTFTTFLSLRDVVGLAYSRDKDVITYISEMMPVLAVSSVLDCFQGLLSGVIRGCGWQKAGAYINLAAYYLVGLPLAILMSFVFHIKAKGLWMGITGGSLVQLVALIAVTFRANWENEAYKAASRVEGQDLLKPLICT
ncbi:hypothetical protein KP509_01G006600 [Ceratopteris richardii]|uniref:Protein DETOXIFICATION n=1 Tax=Ceratopteris richardii TaxID=49495 RepID=A0A8T2VDG6_CERRI|nr:hypothetical protein KP509_01G006600 [Ceratopteris richardii]